jgi:hypothetical protein
MMVLIMCRFKEFKRKDILKKVGEKRSATVGDICGPNKKLKEVYVVSKTKWYLTATRDEMKTLESMVFDGKDMESKHRIIQHKIR